MPTLDEIYSKAWFEKDFDGLQSEFDRAVDEIIARLPIERGAKVLDIGCGPGMMVRRFREHGVRAWGIDGSTHALEYADARIRRYLALWDLRTPLIPIDGWIGARREVPNTVDLVVSTEVAEHIEPEHADTYVRQLVQRGASWIVMTAAGVGQDGNYHVNCQPPEYWIEKLEEYQYWRSPLTDRLKLEWGGGERRLNRISHMARNALVFVRTP